MPLLCLRKHTHIILTDGLAQAPKLYKYKSNTKITYFMFSTFKKNEEKRKNGRCCTCESQSTTRQAVISQRVNKRIPLPANDCRSIGHGHVIGKSFISFLFTRIKQESSTRRKEDHSYEPCKVVREAKMPGRSFGMKRGQLATWKISSTRHHIDQHNRHWCWNRDNNSSNKVTKQRSAENSKPHVPAIKCIAAARRLKV